MTAQVWFDGRLAEAGTAQLTVLDHAFTVGDAVFETMKVVDGVPFALTRHLRRLDRSARGLGLALPDEGAVRDAVTAVLAQAGVPGAARLRITYGGGVAPMGSGRGDASPHLAVAVGAAAPWPPAVDVVTVPWVRNERSAVAGLKTTSYAENVVALAEAHRLGASEALFANTRGELCEGTGSNVFVVRGGRVQTPPLGSGALAGITRELVLEWSDVEEIDLTLADLADADEVFLTSSTRDVQPVRLLDGRVLPGLEGPVTAVVAEQFARGAADRIDP
jgi:branched-chain amino acid aminotransferase